MGCFNSKVQGEAVVKSSTLPIKYESKSSTKDKSEVPSRDLIENLHPKSYRKVEELNNSYKVVDIVKLSQFYLSYKVLHLKTSETRLLKVLRKDSLKIRNESEFIKEVEILLDLDHPNLMKIFDFYTDEKQYYIISELVSRTSTLFEQILCLKGMTERTIAFIIEQVFSSIFYLHSKGIILKYICPENIVIDENTYIIKIIDFGIFHYSNKSTKLSIHSNYPYFTPPENFQSNIVFQTKNDTWSCGVLLFVLLSGKFPFGGDSSVEIIDNIKKGVICFDKSLWDPISNEAKYLVERLMKYDSNKRISVDEAWKDLWIIKFKKSNSIVRANFQINYESIKEINERRSYQKLITDVFAAKAIASDRKRELQTLILPDTFYSSDQLKEIISKYISNEMLATFEVNRIELKAKEAQSEKISSDLITTTLLNEEQIKNLYLDIYSKANIEISSLRKALEVIDPETFEELSAFKSVQNALDNYGESISIEDLNDIILKVSNIFN